MKAQSKAADVFSIYPEIKTQRSPASLYRAVKRNKLRMFAFEDHGLSIDSGITPRLNKNFNSIGLSSNILPPSTSKRSLEYRYSQSDKKSSIATNAPIIKPETSTAASVEAMTHMNLLFSIGAPTK